MSTKLIGMVASGLLLSSCGIYSTYKPVTEVPDRLYGEQVIVEDSISLAMLKWKELFTDSRLQLLVERGLQQNTDLQSSQWRIKEAEATLLSSKLAYLPSLALTPQGNVSSFDSHKAVQTYSLPVAASWELDLFGSLRNAKQQSKALYEQSIAYSQAVRTQLVAGIANTYFTLLMLDEQLRISSETAQLWDEALTSTRALMSAGRANEAAVAQMEAACHSVNTSILDLKEQINKVENSLSLLLAETPHAIERGTLDEQELPMSWSVGLPIQLLSNRPDVRMAERSLEQAFYATNQARASFYPSVTLSGSAGWTNSAGSSIVNPGKFIASAVGSLTQPLFSRGQLAGRLKIAKAQQEEARLGFEQTLLNAGVEVNEALTQYQTAREKSLLFEKQVAALEAAYRSTSLLMEHGTTTYLEVLTARQDLLSARLSQVANRFAEMQGVVMLYQALGGTAE